MKKTVIVTLSLCLIGSLAPGFVQAKGGKGGKKQKQVESSSSASNLAKYDASKDGQLDDEEIAALKKRFREQQASNVEELRQERERQAKRSGN